MSRSTRLRRGSSDVADILTSAATDTTPPQSSLAISPPAQTPTGVPQQEAIPQEQSITPLGHSFSQIRLYADDWNHAPAAAPTPPPAPPSSTSTDNLQVQTKLAVNEPGDAFEQEADHMADLVMRSPAESGEAEAHPALAMPSYYIPRSPNGAGPSVSPAVESCISQMRGGGQPLPEGERSFFEQRFGHDFSQIRIHADGQAAQTAQSLNARAFTVGTDIAFDQGEYQPGTESGRHLLAHELTHTIQQTGGVATKPLQRKAAEHEPAADEGICPVCGKVGKGTCPGCRQPFLPIQRKATEHEPAADEGICPVCGKVGKGTCPGCGQPFLPFQRKARDDKPDAEIEQSSADTQASVETRNQEPAGTSAEGVTEQIHAQQAAATTTAGDISAAGEAPAAAGAGEAASTTTEVVSAPTSNKDADRGSRAEDVGTGNPMLQAVQQSAANGPRQALQDQSQKLRAQLRGPDPKPQAASQPQAALQGATPDQPDPALQGVLAQAQAGRDQARGQADAAGAELANAQSAIGQLAGAPVELAPLDMAVLLQEAGIAPAAPDGPATPIFRKAASDSDPVDGEAVDPVALQAQIEQLRAQAQGMMGSFMASATGRVQGALALGQAAPARLQAPVATAQAAIMTGVQVQSAALTAQFAQARTQAQSMADAQRAQIEVQHSTTLAAIQVTSAQTTQQLEASYQQAVQRVQQLEQAQVQVLNQRYVQGDQDYRAAGARVGQEAVGIGEQMAQSYLSGKINRDDSLTDGDLTDRRCEARAKAAREVASQYQAGLVEEANKQADKAQKGKSRDTETLGSIKTETLTTLENQHRTMLEQARAASEAAQQQAEQTKTRFLEAIEQSLTGAVQTLSEQEASQRQGLETMGQQQAAALDQAGQSTMAALQQSVTQTVAGLQSSLGGLPGALAGVQVPDPEALSGVLGNAMGQIEGGLAALQSQIEQGVAAAEQQFTQQSAQVVQSLETTGQSVSTSVGELVSTLTTTFTQIQSGVQSTYSQIQEAFTTQSSQLQQTASDGFNQVVQGAEQTFQQVNQNIDTAFDQATPALEQGLRGAFGDMRAKIGEEAEKAAAQEQPRWKGILKIVLMIAVIVVVALVIGPFVIGAVGAAAGALGASAAAAGAIGAVVGGAIVGAGTSAVIQMGNNLIDNKPILDGVVEAMITGAIGGAMGGLGGLAGQGLANALRMGQGFAQGALKMGVDMVFDTAGGLLGNIVTGQPITLDGIVQGLVSGVAVSLSMGGLGKMGRLGKGIDGIQQRSMAAGEAFGTNVGTQMRPALGIDTPSPRTPQVDVGTPARPDLAVDSLPAPRNAAVDEPNTAPRNTQEPNSPRSTRSSEETETGSALPATRQEINQADLPTNQQTRRQDHGPQNGTPEHKPTRSSEQLTADIDRLRALQNIDPEIEAHLTQLRGAIENVDARLQRGEINDFQAETLRKRMQEEFELFEQWEREGDLVWIRGSEQASPEMHDWVTRQHNAKGQPLSLEQIRPRYDKGNFREWLDMQSNRANASMNTGGTVIKHRADPRKIELLEEVLHHTQEMVPDFEQHFPYPAYELHVKDFMIRHSQMFGLGPDDVKALQQMLVRQMGSGHAIGGDPLVLPPSATAPLPPPSTGPDLFLNMSVDDIQKMMLDEINAGLRWTKPKGAS